ncbi:recombinase family protein [Archangium lansingense]|uniref:Recombinase family protein n=1 Tax=Archangium lansingense TaxID=2995310 RepID=A0ABT4A3S8_9BACT|nr:recombinase family protein [Archangium lansinium]MCY1076304.1 recombinase family protein [Archangium lansinium]MCY1078819.1 recombinase family protein [Archangium lansinium]
MGHLERQAVVYLRQSTLRQVHEHHESTARQYALQQRALELGWPAERIEIIDEDLGQSGSSSIGRTGFQRLAEQVAYGRVGAIFALEISRLARSSADWHRLLELCGLADVLIIDEQAVYTPRDYNDRLLLGLKGTMSEAEQYWMHLRLQGGKLSKARRGELFFRPPVGYEWDETTGRFRLEPDEQVQRAVRLVFERFRLEGSASAVQGYFAANGLRLPVHDPRTGELHWAPPRYSAIRLMLRNPTYAGAYVFGRHERRMGLVEGQLRRQHSTTLPQEAWKICLYDHHPAYITWEEYMANQRKLSANRANHHLPEQRGAAREGEALLQGLLLCGRCGNRMKTKYMGSKRYALYVCRRRGDDIKDKCWSVPAAAIDEAVARLFLETVQPPETELSLAVTREAEKQAGELERQWQLRLERARYEARLAERRYKAVDPDMRVVARTLEREWNEKLSELGHLESEYQEVLREQKVVLTDEDRARLLALARDLPRVWYAKSTTQAERKNLLRILVREVVLSPIEVPEPMTRVQVLWETGMVSDWNIPRLPYNARTTSPEAINLIGKLQGKKSDEEIAAELNRRGLLTGHKRPWDARAVRWVRNRYEMSCRSDRCLPERRAGGLYSIRGVAKRLGVSKDVVLMWVKQGQLRVAEGGSRGHPLWFKLDQATSKRLKAAIHSGSEAVELRHPEEPHVMEEGHYE